LSPPPLLYGLLALMVFFWSANFVVAKWALREFPPLLLSGLRVVLAGAFISPVYWWHARQSSESQWERSDLRVLIWLGLIGVALNQFCFVMGISRTSVSHAALMMSMTPIMVLIIAALLKLERLTARKLAGMMMAVAGVAILNAFPPAEAAPAARPSLLGDIFVFFAGLTFAVFTVLGKSVTDRHSSVTVNTFAYVGGALALAPMTFWQAREFSFQTVSLAGWSSLIYMALFPSVVCYLIYYYALTYIAATRVASLAYLQPVLATTLGILLLGEHLTPPLIMGALVIFSGVWMTERG
jgi:drug/metabolite transporter (DMT)-like permease